MKQRRVPPELTPGRRRFLRLGAAVFWIAVWQLAAMFIHQEILLASPVSVAARLISLLPEPSFWRAVLFSFSRITLGFLLACLCGILLAGLASRFFWAQVLIQPLMGVIKATPVASFIILVLIWLPSRHLSIFISLLMVTPIIYSNTLAGIGNMDQKLLAMADVFEVPFRRRLRYFHIPQVLPFFRSACAVSLGLCWKAGVAAEVIGLPQGSIGERLSQAKIYLETPELLAWTLVIILISMGFEKLFLCLLDTVSHRLEQG